MVSTRLLPRTALAILLALPTGAPAQVVDLTIDDVGIAIGDKPRMTGLRINFRDARLEEINGINITLWSPYEGSHGTVNGLALGLPVTGAERINGIATGLLHTGIAGEYFERRAEAGKYGVRAYNAFLG